MNIFQGKEAYFMTQCQCDVTPNQPWPQDGTAIVDLTPSCNMTGRRTLPLKHFPTGEKIIINRIDYPEGLVVMPISESEPSTPARLPCKIEEEDVIILYEQDWPNSAVGWFKEQ